MFLIVFLNLLVIVSAKTLIDLTHPFEDGYTITWPKSPKFNFTIRNALTNTMTMVEVYFCAKLLSLTTKLGHLLCANNKNGLVRPT